MKASNVPVSVSNVERTGALIRCCFLAAEAIASSSAAIQRSRSISFSRATCCSISVIGISVLCACAIFVFAFLEFRLEPGNLNVGDPYLQPLAALIVDQLDAGRLVGVERLESADYRSLCRHGRFAPGDSSPLPEEAP